MMEHEFDWHDWCIHCGAGAADALEGTRAECNRGVVGISHIVRTRRLAALIDDVMAQCKMRQYEGLDG